MSNFSLASTDNLLILIMINKLVFKINKMNKIFFSKGVGSLLCGSKSKIFEVIDLQIK